MAEELVDEKPLDEEPTELTDEDLDRITDTAIRRSRIFSKYFEVGEVTIDDYRRRRRRADPRHRGRRSGGADWPVTARRSMPCSSSCRRLPCAPSGSVTRSSWDVRRLQRAVSARSWNRLPVLPRTAQLARTAASSFVRCAITRRRISAHLPARRRPCGDGI